MTPEYKKRWAQANRELIRKRANERYWAQRDDPEFKAKRAAIRLKSRERDYATNAAWRAANPERHREMRKLWVKENPERVLEIRRRFAKKRAGKQSEYQRAQRLAHPEVFRKRLKAWKEKNPHKNAHHCMLRKTRRLKATPAWADRELIDLVYAEARHRGLQVDHAVPLRGKLVCGLHVHYNLQLLSRAENDSKGNAFPYPSKIQM